MTETPQRDPLTRTLKSLTIAIWCLCALSLAQLVVYATASVRMLSFSRAPLRTSVGRQPSRTPRPIPGEPVRGSSSFHDLPPEEMVRKASAILVTQWRKVDGEVKEIVTEIIKHRPGTTLHYSVGDEYETFGGRSSRYVAGDGNVIFMEDSPEYSGERSSYSYSGERVGGFADMSLKKLRELAKAAE